MNRLGETGLEMAARRNSCRALAVVLALAAVFVTVPSRADYMPLSGAEVAPNIAEIRVEDDGVRIGLEIFVADAARFENLIPDDWFRVDVSARPSEAERLADFAESGLTVRRGDGRALPVRLDLIEPRMRVDRTTPLTGARDPVTGRIFPKPPDDPRVLFADLFYDFAGDRPAVIEIAPPSDAGGLPLVTIGMVVFDRGVPVTNFRYLSGPARLTLEWDDPWYSRFDNPNLRRHHQSGVTTYLYVEPRELRHETLIRVRDIDPWIGLDLDAGTQLPAEDQARIKDQAAAFIASRNPVSIDGRLTAPDSYRAEFLRIQSTGLQIIEGDEPVNADAAFVGVILSFSHSELPETVSVTWDMFNDRVSQVPATSTDPAGPFLSGATVDDPEIVWTNHLLTYQNPMVTPVSVGTAGRLRLPLASMFGALLCAGAIIVAVGMRGTGRMLVAGLALASGVMAVVAWDHAAIHVPNPVAGPPDTAAATEIFAALLDNVNTAHLEVSAEARRNALRKVVTGASLADVTAELDRALAIRVPGGGIARVTSIEHPNLQDLSPVQEGYGFQALANWSVQAGAGHWGHSHRRALEYRALVEVVEEAGVWKLDAITVVETRTPDV